MLSLLKLTQLNYITSRIFIKYCIKNYLATKTRKNKNKIF
jgi:hypothetical protein